MVRQLIFTSSPMGLEPGRSGYCTVARDKSLPQRIVREIESISVLDLSESEKSPPKVDAFRLLKAGSNQFYLLSRIRSAGQDYTNRTNYLAHHLIIDPEETEGLPSPADILAGWDGWLDEWSDNPRYLEQDDAPDLSSSGIDSPARSLTWFQWSGDENNAAIPQNDKSIFRIHPGDEERLLQLYAESSAQLESPQQAWKIPFTTFLQPNESSADFLWIGGWPQTAADRIKSAQVVNSLELTPFDDEMAAMQLPVEEAPEEPEPVPEEPEPIDDEPEPIDEEPEPIDEELEPVAEEPEPVDEEPEPVPEEPVEPEQVAAYQAPQETASQPEEITPEVDITAPQKTQQTAAVQPSAARPQSPKRPVGAFAGRRKIKRYQQTPARASQATVVNPRKSQAMTYWIIALAACVIVIVTLGVKVNQMTNRIDELETQNAQLIKDTEELRWRVGLANEQNDNLSLPQQPEPTTPPPRPPTTTPPRPTPTEPPINVPLIKLEVKPPPGGLPPNQKVNLEMVIVGGLRQVLKKPSGPITPADYNKLGELDVKDLGIDGLSGLERVGNLRTLKLTNNQVRDLKPLQTTTKLVELNLSGNQISDVTPLGKLINLQRLFLIRNPVEDIQPLGQLTQLTSLTLGPSQIQNHWPLAKLTNLRMAWLGDTQFQDLRPLQGLVKLNKLVLSNNDIEDVSPLAKLINLTELHLNNNRINDVEPLLNLQNLTELELKNNPIPDNQRQLLRRELPNCKIWF